MTATGHGAIPGGLKDWDAYYRAVSGNPARETTIQALDSWQAEHGGVGFAVDLACGEGRDTVEFLRRGWRVLAVDSEPGALEWLRGREDLPKTATLETACAAMEEADWDRADIVNASFALPFCPPARFDGLWRHIVESLPAGGRFAGQIFGPDDSWASPALSIFDRDGVGHLFAKFDFERCEEINRDGRDARGKPKHWHVFHIVARKMPGSSA